MTREGGGFREESETSGGDTRWCSCEYGTSWRSDEGIGVYWSHDKNRKDSKVLRIREADSPLKIEMKRACIVLMLFWSLHTPLLTK